MSLRALPARILLGVRDRDLKTLLEYALRDARIEVDSAERAEDFVSKAVTGQNGLLVICDDISSYGLEETLRQLQAFEKSSFLPVLVLSGQAPSPELSEALRPGRDQVLRWPLPVSRLLTAIEVLSASAHLVAH